jgi:hypothetical protein
MIPSILPRLALTASILLAIPSSASAEPAFEERDHVSEHPEAAHHRFVMGANALMLGAIAHGHAVGEYGPGGFLEVVVIRNWLEVEVGAHYLRTTSKISEIPIDLILKKPFHPLPWLNPYVGVGPTVIPTFASHERTVHFGVVTQVGSYFWLTPHLGFSAEMDYNLVSDHGLTQEVAGSSGVVVGF